MIELYKDGDHMAIKTNAINEHVFLCEMSKLLSDMIARGMFFNPSFEDSDPAALAQAATEDKDLIYDNDWEFQFYYWLPLIVDICCKYRGLKSDVQERVELIAGDPSYCDMIPTATMKTDAGAYV